MVNFDIEQIFNTNKRTFIWTFFFLLLYLVRGLFGLVFITFILCFIFNNLITWLNKHTRLPRRLWTILLYLVFIALVTTILASVGPKLGAESTIFIKQIPQTINKFYGYLDQLAQKYDNLWPLVERIKDGLSLEKFQGEDLGTVLSILVKSINQITHYFSYFLLGTLFSFLILLDFPTLKERVQALTNTRLKQVYEETAGSVVQFALVVGEAFQAQILIATVNTSLTAVGLMILNINPVALLSTIVFFAGLIPVLGVFISSVPIMLLAFNAGGLPLILGALIMIIIVHLLEAYVLNPRIFSAVFKINPVLTLIILYIGHSLFGIWGVLLGVPISVFIYRYSILGQDSIQGQPNQDTAIENPENIE